MWPLWAALAAAASALYYLTILRRHAGGKHLPPGPKPLPIIGNLLNLGGVFHHTLTSLARTHGPVMTLKLGLTTAVVISSRDAAREAYTKHDRRLAAHAIPDSFRVKGYSDRAMAMLPSSDPRWKTLRGIHATHIFSPRGLAAVRGIREAKVREIISYFRAHAGKEVLVGQAVYSGVLNLTSSSFFSVDMADLGSESAQGLRELLEGIIAAMEKPNVSDFFPFLRALDLQGLRRQTGRRFASAFHILDSIIERRLRLADAHSESRDYLDALLELVPAGKIARIDVTLMLFDVLVAGADAMSVTIEWAMAELLRNPSVMAKVRAEMRGVLGSKETIEEPDAEKLPYLQVVLKEVMRLHPVAPILIPHRATEDGVEIGGYAVPKGSTVIFNAWGIMRDPAAWERPHEFLPERFLQTVSQLDYRGKDIEFIPFGSGRRLCPGVPMAERILPFILASLLHAFEWQLPDGMSAEEMDMTGRFTTVNVLTVPLKAVPTVLN